MEGSKAFLTLAKNFGGPISQKTPFPELPSCTVHTHTHTHTHVYIYVFVYVYVYIYLYVYV